MQQQIMILHYYNVYMIHGCINQDLKPIYVIIRIYIVILTYIMKSYILYRSNSTPPFLVSEPLSQKHLEFHPISGARRRPLGLCAIWSRVCLSFALSPRVLVVVPRVRSTSSSDQAGLSFRLTRVTRHSNTGSSTS